MDCGGKGRVATDIATYECSIYRVENEHDVVIEPRLQPEEIKRRKPREGEGKKENNLLINREKKGG